MQVPERLALIGGSILLSSTLVFTLKSQASNISPKIGDAVNAVMKQGIDNGNGSQSPQLSEDEKRQQAEEQKKSQEEAIRQQTQQKREQFQNGLADAKKQGLPTGQWGSADYYIDHSNQMHIGGGQLQGSLTSIIGSRAIDLTSIDFTDSVKAPTDSTYLLSTSTWFSNDDSQLTSIQHLDNLDTSQTTNMNFFFYNNKKLTRLDASSLNTLNVTSMVGTFSENVSLQDLSVSGWNVQNVTNANYAFNHMGLTELDLSSWHTRPNITLLAMFANSPSLQSLNINNFDTSQSSTMQDMYSGSGQLRQIYQGSQTKNAPLNNTGLVNGNWSHSGNTLDSYNFQGNGSNPGTWVRQ